MSPEIAELEAVLNDIVCQVIAISNPITRFHAIGWLQKWLDETEKAIPGERGQCIKELREASVSPKLPYEAVGQTLGLSSSRAQQLAHIPRREEWKTKIMNSQATADTRISKVSE